MIVQVHLKYKLVIRELGDILVPARPTFISLLRAKVPAKLVRLHSHRCELMQGRPSVFCRLLNGSTDYECRANAPASCYGGSFVLL